MKIKILYTEDGNLLFSKQWPGVPPVMASIYADTLAMNRYNREMEYALRYAIPVENIDDCMALMVWQVGEIIRGKFYELECDYTHRAGKIIINR